MLVQQKQNIKGFTLLELLVVIAIVGIVSAVGYPRLDAWVSKNRVKSEAEKIASLFASVTSQVERGYYPYAMIEFESGTFPTVIKAQGVSQNAFTKRIRKIGATPIACTQSDFLGWNLPAGSANKEWQLIGSHTMHEDTFIDKLAKKNVGGSGGTICFSKGGQYFKPPTGLGYKLFDGETDQNKATTNYITICHNNTSNCDTTTGSFDTAKKFDAYLVRYSRFGIITKYRYDFKQSEWIGY